MAEQFLSAQTADDFQKVKNKAKLNLLLHFLQPEETKMLSLCEAKKLLKPTGEVYKGLQIVKVDQIVGSENRFKDFDNHFMPTSSYLQTRWEHIDMAYLNGETLPPIMLYELGGLYFVRDGNHRVSVAKAQGVEAIDAEVISLQSKIKLKVGETKQKMLLRVINYEKKCFYSQTNFAQLTGNWSLDFSTAGMYDVIYNHILMHKYYINQNKNYELSLETAIVSWYNTIYHPIIVAIDDFGIIKKFKKKTYGDLYVWLVKYWDDLKQVYGNDYSIQQATKEFEKSIQKHHLLHFLHYIRRKTINAIKKFFCTLSISNT